MKVCGWLRVNDKGVSPARDEKDAGERHAMSSESFLIGFSFE